MRFLIITFIALLVSTSSSAHSTYMTWDHFNSLAYAMKHLAGENVLLGGENILEQSNMSEYDPDGFRYRVLFENLDSRF